MNIDIEVNRTYTPSRRIAVLAPAFAVSLFTSAALLFWVQPLVAKMLLPLLGGAPSVWNTCMVFFQALLLSGYAYVLLISRFLSLRNQALVHGALLVGAGFVLPLALSSQSLNSVPTESSPIFWLLGTLLITVGPPFFILSATAPLLQRWFSHSTHKSAHDPYFLYAVSNAGSMLALLAFPFFLEPRWAIKTQSTIWSSGYALLCGLIMMSLLVLRQRGSSRGSSPVAASVTRVSSGLRLQWIALAFVPSSLMLGVTTYIATDVASVPLIWIIPLALYLLTFILAFSNKQVIGLSLASVTLPVAIICLAALMIFKFSISSWILIALHLTIFFLAAFICHRRLALIRPAVDRLPEYYLWVAVGGVVGGIFNALVAPIVFSTPVEYPLVVVLACLMRPSGQTNDRERPWLRIGLPSFLFLLTFALSVIVPKFGFSDRLQNLLVLILPLGVCYLTSIGCPVRFALTLAAVMLGAIPYLNANQHTLLMERNFFGRWLITEETLVLNETTEPIRRLWHGSTIHGMQFDEVGKKCVATTYFHNDGPLGKIFAAHRSNASSTRVAATGLGAGTIATYSAPGEQWDFYEIDPAIVRIATDSRYFTFLSDCAAAPYRMILGDARLRMREAPANEYGLIVMDAFSSDSVPAHLLTTQAVDLYLSKLAQDGLLAFHISNRYLDLEPLLSGLSRQAKLSAVISKDEERNVVGRYPSVWVVFARSDQALGGLASDPRWTRLQGDVVWTDEFSNIFGLVK